VRHLTGSRIGRSNGMGVLRCLPAAIALLAGLDRYGLAADEFQDLVSQIPRSANAVVLLNLEKAIDSPVGMKAGWKEKVEKAFEAGLARVPPQAKRLVLASQLDFELKEPLWEAAVIDCGEQLWMQRIAQSRGGTADTIEGMPALARPNDTYLVQLVPKRLAAMGPGNRQAVVRWIREVRKPSSPPLSPYLQKAAVYSDEAGSEIIMALDLEDLMSFERVGKYLKAHEKSLRKWQAKDETPASLTDVARVLASIRGVRIGVRLGEPHSAKIVVDLRNDATSISSIAKPLLLQVLSDSGALINDFQSWPARVVGSEISLAGGLSSSGLRRLLSLVDSPVSGDVAAPKAPAVSPGEVQATHATKSREYFRTVVGMADDLKDDMKNAKNLASTSLFFDKYAKRIDRMPILNVDEELLKYSALVADHLRKASQAIKAMGIQSGVGQAGITSSGDAGYGGYEYRGSGASAGLGEIKAVGAERRVVRAEEKSIAAGDVQHYAQAIIAATTDIRRRMTQKYQVEF
jgi:hypothetical protein